MLDTNATHMGAGCYCKDGNLYWVQIFATNPDQKFTLTVDANGGYFPSKGGATKFDMQVPSGMSLSTDNIPQPEKDGAAFDRWTAIDSTDIEYGISGHINMYESQTLKANWTDSSN